MKQGGQARAGRTAQLVEEKEDDENIELYKICHQLFVRKQSLSLRNYTYMDDYFVPDRKKEWLERYKGGGNKSIFCKRVLG